MTQHQKQPEQSEGQADDHETEDVSPEQAAPESDEVGDVPEDADHQAQPADDIKIEALQAELEKTRDQLLRTAAELENTRRRAMKDREDASKFAISGFAKDLLDFSDNFKRALEAIPEDVKSLDDRVVNVITGVEAMQKELLKTFEKHGIQKIEPMHEPFDPNYHEAMFEGEDPSHPPGTIIQLIEPGYILQGRLLRPARVGVAKDGGAPQNQSVDQQV